MPHYVIPTIFTGVNGLHQPIQSMKADLSSLKSKLDLTGKSSMGSGLFSTAKNLLIGGGIAAAVGMTGKSILDYQSEVSNLSALTGATGSKLDDLKSSIRGIAEETKTSSVSVTQSMTSVANNMPDLLQDVKGLGMVTQSSIQLAKAARMELGPAGEAVTDIMNQYGASAKYAAKMVDILAAGSVAGSSEIIQTAEAIKQVGVTAKMSGVGIDESVAMVELISRAKKGAEAGVGLRNVLSEMNKGMAQDPQAIKDLNRLGVNIKLVANNAVPLAERLHELKKAAGDQTAMIHMFGKENLVVAQTLLNNSDLLPNYINLVNKNGEAARMAAVNTDNLSSKVQQLTDKWITITSTSSNINAGLKTTGRTIDFVTNHMEGLINALVVTGGLYYSRKGLLILYNKALQVNSYITGLASIRTGRLNEALGGTKYEAKGARDAVRLLASGINSVGFAAIGATGLLYAFSEMFTDEVKGLDDYNDQLDRMKIGFRDLKQSPNQARLALEQYNKAMDEYQKVQDKKANINYEKSLHGKGYGLLMDIRESKNMLGYLDIFNLFGGNNAKEKFRIWNKATIEMDSRNKELFKPNKLDFFKYNPADTSLIPQMTAEDSLLHPERYQSAQLEPMKDKQAYADTKKERLEITINDNSRSGIAVDDGGVKSAKVRLNSTFNTNWLNK